MDFDYFYNREAERFNFLKVPEILVDGEEFRGLSAEAIILCSESLKSMAQHYEVSYPTIRLRIDRLIQKISEAKKRGVQFGRKAIIKPKNFDEVAKLWKNGKVSLREGAKLLNVSHSTFSKWLKNIS